MLEWLLVYYFVSFALPVDRWTERGPREGGGECPSSKNVLGLRPPAETTPGAPSLA